MVDMSAHARKGWTIPQVTLGAVCAVLGLAVAILGFIDIYLTVTHLLQQWWHGWSWTVIVLGEGSFAGCYSGWLLLDLRDRPTRQVRVFLAAYLALFAAGSLALNVYAARESFPAAASHVIVVFAFFGYLMFAKVLVKRLSADPGARALEVAMADARQYAIDLLRSQMGVFWRWRCPSLLKRQVLRGRLPDEVRESVALKVSVGRTSGWEAPVRDWVLGPDGLNLAVQAGVAAEKVRADITRQAVPAPPESESRAPAELPSEKVARAPARTRPRQGFRQKGRQASDGDLVSLLADLLGEDPGMSINDAMKHTGCARPRSRRLLDAARAEERQSRMVRVK